MVIIIVVGSWYYACMSKLLVLQLSHSQRWLDAWELARLQRPTAGNWSTQRSRHYVITYSVQGLTLLLSSAAAVTSSKLYFPAQRVLMTQKTDKNQIFLLTCTAEQKQVTNTILQRHEYMYVTKLAQNSLLDWPTKFKFSSSYRDRPEL